MTLLREPSIQLNKSLTVLKTTFCENAPEYFLSSKSDNLLSSFFSDQLDQQLALHENLLGLWHSYVNPQFNWTSLWLYWKPLFVKTHQNIFWARNLTTYWVLFFSDQLDQQLVLHENLLGLWHSYVNPQFNWTSLWLYWKPLFVKTHQNIFWARNLTTYWVLFFSDQLDQQLVLHENLLGLWHSYVNPQFNWTSLWLYWKPLFVKTHQNIFWARNLTTYWVLFFSDQLDQQLVLHENLLGLWNSYVDSQFNWTSPWLYWKPLFMKTHQNIFWARNLTTYWVLFFSDQLDQQLVLHENLLGLWHSYVNPQFNWTSLWLYWKPLFVKTHQNIFWARNLTTYWVLFFSDQLDQQLVLHENLLGLWHSYVNPEFNWTSLWLYWKPLFVKTHQNMFWARNLTTYWVLFFSDHLCQQLALQANLLGLRHSYVSLISIEQALDCTENHILWNCTRIFLSSKSDNLSSNFFSDQLDQQLAFHENLLGLWHSYVNPQFNWTSLWLYWKPLFVKTHQNIFWTRNLTTYWVLFFSDQLDQQLVLHENLLGLWHSYVNPQFNWTSLWLYWKPLFVETHQNMFWARNLTTYWVLFFSDHLYQQLALQANLLGLWHSYVSLISIEQALDCTENHILWKCTRIFFELEIWQPSIKIFFLRPARSTISSPWEPTRTMTRHSYLDS